MAIYGPDDRQDFYQVCDASLRRLMYGTVIVVDRANLRPEPDGTFSLTPLKSLAELKNLCPGEPFARQVAVGAEVTSGFFISPTVVVTAGHRTGDLVFVTGFWMPGAGLVQTRFGPDSVYDGVVVIRRMDHGLNDFALIRVACRGKAPVARPLVVAPTPDVQIGDLVSMPGHPSGLPAKFAANGVVRESGEIVSNLDSFGGNEGSPVLNTAGQVVGVFVRGEADFETDPAGCNRLKRFPATGGQGVNVKRLDGIIGRVRDLSITLGIGAKGILYGRRVSLRLTRTGTEIELPQNNYVPGNSYTIPLDPALFGVATTEDIVALDFHSPPRIPRPPAPDDWILDTVTLSVNGGQPLYALAPRHSFGDEPRWRVELGTVTDAWTIGDQRAFSGGLSSVTVMDAAGRPVVHTFGKDTTGAMVRLTTRENYPPVWFDFHSPTTGRPIRSAPAVTRLDLNVRAYLLSDDSELLEWAPNRTPTWVSLGRPPSNLRMRPALTATNRIGRPRLDVLGVSTSGRIVHWSYLDNVGWTRNDHGTPPPQFGSIAGPLSVCTIYGTRADAYFISDRHRVARLAIDNQDLSRWEDVGPVDPVITGGGLLYGPSVVSRSRGRVDLFGIGLNMHLVQYSFDGVGTWKWIDIRSVRSEDGDCGVTGGVAASTRDGDTLDLTCVGENGHVFRASYDEMWLWNDLGPMRIGPGK